MAVKTYTVWVIKCNGRGTCHVSSHRARSPEGAAKQALAETCYDWGMPAAGQAVLHVLGIAEGEVNLIEWNDID